MKRAVIKIDEEKCTGCGLCIPDCPEGALQIIDGKARLVSDLFCDGLGACIGSCPEGAISTEEREAEPYDEKRVMENIVAKGENTIKAHLKHLIEHGEKEYYRQAVEFLEEKGIKVDIPFENRVPKACPGMKTVDIKNENLIEEERLMLPSQLKTWPVQMHLVSPYAAYFKGADVILAADCVAYAAGDFHSKFLKGRPLIIACPKLDTNKERYIDKIKSLVDEAQINTLNLVIMEVPCCRGLLEIAREGLSKASRKVPLKLFIIGINGDLISEEWI